MGRSLDRIQYRYGWSNEYVIGRRLIDGGDGLSYTELIQKSKIVAEARLDEFQKEAYWSWRANMPMAGEGEDKVVIPFKNWFAQLTNQKIEPEEPELMEITDEEIEFLMKAGRQKFRPPGM